MIGTEVMTTFLVLSSGSTAQMIYALGGRGGGVVAELPLPSCIQNTSDGHGSERQLQISQTDDVTGPSMMNDQGDGIR
jgi:hypothetical protein